MGTAVSIFGETGISDHVTETAVLDIVKRCTRPNDDAARSNVDDRRWIEKEWQSHVSYHYVCGENRQEEGRNVEYHKKEEYKMEVTPSSPKSSNP